MVPQPTALLLGCRKVPRPLFNADTVISPSSVSETALLLFFRLNEAYGYTADSVKPNSQEFEYAPMTADFASECSSGKRNAKQNENC